MKCYALYRGDEFLTLGTISELADYLQVKPSSVRFMTTPSYTRRKKEDGHHLIVIKLEDDE